MGWPDHLSDPDEWQQHMDAQLAAADLARDREPITCAYGDIDESAMQAEDTAA